MKQLLKKLKDLLSYNITDKLEKFIKEGKKQEAIAYCNELITNKPFINYETILTLDSLRKELCEHQDTYIKTRYGKKLTKCRNCRTILKIT
jgi:hypothetical protein